MPGTLVKVCGMTSGQNIRDVESLGVDLMGFIFYDKSPRCCREVPSYLPSCRRVGVFVDLTASSILQKDSQYHFDYIQLHGSETPELCSQLRDHGFKVIKALSIRDAADMRKASMYQDCCDFLLFDTKCTSVGGSGQKFDWSLLEEYQGKLPFLLSGGLSASSARDLKPFSHPALCGYDLNSRFETSPGVKDTALLSEFMKDLKDMGLR